MSSESPGYTLLRVSLRSDAVELAESLLLENGALSCSFTDAADTPLLEPAPGDTPLWPEVVVTGMFTDDANLTALTTRLKSQLIEYQIGAIDIRPLAQQQWERVWMKDFAPLQISESFWVVPSFAQPPDAAATNLIIDPGLAFGSGTHATTLLCLQWLAGQDLRGKTVLDYGCGSGILAIAAAMLGADSVQAIDIDPQACLSTRDNAARNGVAGQIAVTDDDRTLHAPVDILVANILLNPLLERVAQFRSLLNPGGQLALSGVLEDQAGQLCGCYDGPFRESHIVTHEGWLLYTAFH